MEKRPRLSQGYDYMAKQYFFQRKKGFGTSKIIILSSVTSYVHFLKKPWQIVFCPLKILINFAILQYEKNRQEFRRGKKASSKVSKLTSARNDKSRNFARIFKHSGTCEHQARITEGTKLMGAKYQVLFACFLPKNGTFTLVCRVFGWRYDDLHGPTLPDISVNHPKSWFPNHIAPIAFF